MPQSNPNVSYRTCMIRTSASYYFTKINLNKLCHGVFCMLIGDDRRLPSSASTESNFIP